MGAVGYHLRAIIRRMVPAPLLRRKRKLQKLLADRAARAERKEAMERHGLFGPEFLFDTLKSSGIRPGCVLLVQSSWTRFHNFSGTAKDVVDVLESLVGADGTLLMPAHTHFDDEGPFVFDVNRSPAHTGLICEMFRREPGVVRSLHPTHSVCARGPLAEILTRDHHKEPLSCGPLSPYAKLMAHGGEILGLGLPPVYTTFLHVVEDLDLAGYPRKTYLDGEFDFEVIDRDGGKMALRIKKRDPAQGSSLDLNIVVPHLTEAAHKAFSIAGVPAFLAKSGLLYAEMLRLKERGILIYS